MSHLHQDTKQDAASCCVFAPMSCTCGHESAAGLEKQLDALASFCEERQLTVNLAHKSGTDCHTVSLCLRLLPVNHDFAFCNNNHCMLNYRDSISARVSNTAHMCRTLGLMSLCLTCK